VIILASQSPRRKEILKDILGDIPFQIIPSSFDERNVHEKDVKKLCLLEAQGKGRELALKYPNDIVISADTMVSYKGQQLGKPADEEDIYRMLRMLSGDVHEVVTAYAIYQGNKELVHRICTAEIYIEKMADAEIQAYIDTGSPFDKAGAYGIQDKDCIECKILKGDYYTVVGLPRDDLEDDLFQLHIID
jgi:septum formation protein maf